MRVGIIATDGGEHPPEVMAAACADQIVSIDPSSPRWTAALRLKADIIDVLVPHCTAICRDTKEELESDAASHFARTDLHDPGVRLDQTIDAIHAITDSTDWADQFRDPTNVAAMRQVVGQFLVDMAHLERLYHRDRNPNDAHACAYAEQPTGIAVVPAWKVSA